MPSPEAVIKQIQATGERMTIQRRLIVEALCAAAGHTSISDLQHWLQANYPAHELSDATIYRILQWLKNLELVAQTDMGSAGIVYELLGQAYHHHLICLNCGRVFDLGDHYLAPLRQALADDLKFQARIDHMAIYGLCADCAARQATEKSAQAPA
ncbi:MAG TPA: Fur family transcriptional regulator [Phototrophicaceae bacterium]|nr:Fur family transcriptional regulator [Phototrophicaceae bacterium]